jgi:acyl-CoA synthetase (NDP forming)
MHTLDHMLRAGSVAVIGASERPGSVGEQTLRQLQGGGFTGTIHPVNPGYETVLGLPCHPSIHDVGGPVDLAVLAVANARLEEETEKAIAAGAGALAIFASCHGEAADGSPLRDRIATLANEAGVPICGGNGMGFLNIEDGVRICGFHQPYDLEPGGVTFLSHSGSLFSAMLHNRRGLRFNLVVSTGLELNTRMSDYMDWALARESTTVLTLFLETIRDPEGFRKALGVAQDRGVPVVSLKVGSSQRGREAVATHSEAIAGDDAVYEALFDAHGVHRVTTMDELVDTAELFAAGRRPHRGGLGAVHDSGGERALLIDNAERVGVPLPSLGPETVATLTDLLDPGLEAQNPVDAWGTGRDAKEVFSECLAALARDPAIGVVAFSVDLTAEENPDDGYGSAVLDAAKTTDKPFAVLANIATTVDPAQADVIRAGGIPVLQGTETGLRAIGHLLDRAERLEWPAQQERLSPPWPGPTGDHALLGHYGIPTPRTIGAIDVDEVLEAARIIGYPVVLKTTAAAHKTEVGGVVVGIEGAEHLAVAYEDMSRRLGPEVAVSQQIPAGVEIALGMVDDPQFGPVVLVSAGGTLIEMLRDRVALLPPVDRFRATRAIERLAVVKLLSGYRGSAPADVSALAEVVARFSELVADTAGIFASVDLNPVIVGPDSAVAVDFLFQT